MEALQLIQQLLLLLLILRFIYEAFIKQLLQLAELRFYICFGCGLLLHGVAQMHACEHSHPGAGSAFTLRCITHGPELLERCKVHPCGLSGLHVGLYIRNTGYALIGLFIKGGSLYPEVKQCKPQVLKNVFCPLPGILGYMLNMAVDGCIGKPGVGQVIRYRNVRKKSYSFIIPCPCQPIFLNNLLIIQTFG